MRRAKIKPSDLYICKFWAGRFHSNETPFEDLVQTGILAILSCSQESHRWLAVRNAIQQEVSKANRQLSPRPNPAISFDARTEGFQEVLSEDPRFKQIDDEDYLEDLIYKAKLTPRERACIQLTIQDGLTTRQAEKILGIDHTAVSRQAQRGLEKLRKQSKDLQL